MASLQFNNLMNPWLPWYLSTIPIYPVVTLPVALYCINVVNSRFSVPVVRSRASHLLDFVFGLLQFVGFVGELQFGFSFPLPLQQQLAVLPLLPRLHAVVKHTLETRTQTTGAFQSCKNALYVIFGARIVFRESILRIIHRIIKLWSSFSNK